MHLVEGEQRRRNEGFRLFNGGAGLKNRRLPSFSFRFLADETKKHTKCAQECAQNGVPKQSVTTTR